MHETLKNVVNVVLEYDTPKIVHIRNKRVGFLNRLIQCAIVTYVIAWVIVINKGYQDFSTINSSVTTKVKGVVVTNFSAHELNVADVAPYNRVWDVAEYVIPAQENGAFFVLTNAVITPNQTESDCAEEPSDDTICNETTVSEICKAGTIRPNGNGVFTGRCVRYNDKIETCEVHAWCPIERDALPIIGRPLLSGTENFTVLLKNSIEFPLWKIKTRNILKSSNKSYLSSCHYDEDTDPSCPIFRLGTIVEKGGEENYTQLAATGGVMAIIIHWDCNFDYSVDECIPTYEFRRLDDPDAQIAQGWNFRFAKYFDNEKTRTLYKAYGILFIVLVQGRGGKFSTIPFLMNIGSGLALLSIAVICCDVVALYILKKGEYYKEKKYLTVKDDETDRLQENENVAHSSKQVGKYKTFGDETDGTDA